MLSGYLDATAFWSAPVSWRFRVGNRAWSRKSAKTLAHSKTLSRPTGIIFHSNADRSVFHTADSSIYRLPVNVSLSEYWEKFINQQIASGQYGNASEVVREALRYWRDARLRAPLLIRSLKLHSQRARQ
jgi:antitoxin ParD1/3/4